MSTASASASSRSAGPWTCRRPRTTSEPPASARPAASRTSASRPGSGRCTRRTSSATAIPGCGTSCAARVSRSVVPLRPARALLLVEAVVSALHDGISHEHAVGTPDGDDHEVTRTDPVAQHCGRRDPVQTTPHQIAPELRHLPRHRDETLREVQQITRHRVSIRLHPLAPGRSATESATELFRSQQRAKARRGPQRSSDPFRPRVPPHPSLLWRRSARGA